jgi:phosphoribosylaminoimidazole-succinocarboxamide synthase
MTPASNSSSAAGRGLFHTDLSLPGMRRGKVRDVYDLPDSRLLIIASDRISAFDVVMPTPVPGKGRVLTKLSLFWLRFIESRGLARTHLLSDAVSDIPAAAFKGDTRALDLEGRVMIGRKCKVVPIECVVRGYLEGSGWKEYKDTGRVCGIALPPGLRQCDRLPEPIFTPATKEELGKHDENISFAAACAKVGEHVITKLRDTSIAIYNAASTHALDRGIIIADTKFEFGVPESGGDPIVIDEALTPDSSRFWPADAYAPGKAQRSFDKQYLREYLQDLVDRGLWNKQAPGPELPDAIIAATLERYREACERLV